MRLYWFIETSPLSGGLAGVGCDVNGVRLWQLLTEDHGISVLPEDITKLTKAPKNWALS